MDNKSIKNVMRKSPIEMIYRGFSRGTKYHTLNRRGTTTSRARGLNHYIIYIIIVRYYRK